MPPRSLSFVPALLIASAFGCPKPAPEPPPPADATAPAGPSSFQKARDALNAGEIERAKPLFEAAAKEQPDDPMPWANLGTIATETGAMDDAIAAFSEAKRRAPTHEGFARHLSQLEKLKASGGDLPKVDGLELRAHCAKCHAWTDPKILPRFAWPRILDEMWRLNEGFGGMDPRALQAWFRIRSPKRVEVPDRKAGVGLGSLPLERRPLGPIPPDGRPGTANVQFLDIFGDARLELLASDMVNGKVFVGLPAGGEPGLFVLGTVPTPAHIAMVDFDADGHRDLLVANLGSVAPELHRRGTAVWLRQKADRTFETIELASGYGRVADVEAGDLDGDGDLDLVIAEYGTRQTGGVHVLENRGFKKGRPRLKARRIDERAGAIHTPIIDINGDGRLDIIALHAEHHEQIVAHMNRGKMKFEKTVIFAAPHASWGYTGLELVDVDGDGDMDLLATNGDGFDAGADVGGLLHPFHGVQIFENEGGTFKPRPHLQLRGAYGSVGADLDGDGDIDIVSGVFQPFLPEAVRKGLELDSLVWFEQVAPWTFERRAIEIHATEHTTVAAADYDLDGDVDIAAGVFVMEPIEGAPAEGPRLGLWNRAGGGERPDFVQIWENRRPPAAQPPR